MTRVSWQNLRNGYTRLHILLPSGITLCGETPPPGRRTRRSGRMCGQCKRMLARREMERAIAEYRRENGGTRIGAVRAIGIDNLTNK